MGAEVTTRGDDWRLVERDWRRLSAAAAPDNVFLSWEWVAAWCEVFASRRRRPSFVVATDRGGAVIGLLATEIDEGRPGPFRIRQRRLVGSGEAGADHLDALVEPGAAGEAAAAIAAELVAGHPRATLLRMDGLAATSPLAAEVVVRTVGVPLRRLDTACPYLPLPGSWDDLLRGLSANRREVLRRKERLLRRDHPDAVRFHRVTTEHELREGFAALVRLHSRGAFADPQVTAFHADVARRLLACGWLRLYVLTVGEQVVAVINCIRRGGRVVFLHTGYDAAFATYSPGMLVLAHAIRASIEEGAAEFDFLRGDEPYKRHWTDRARTDVRMWVALRPLGGLVLHGHSAARAMRNRVWRPGRERVVTALRRASSLAG